MHYESTRNNKIKKTFSEVLLLGIEEDGGLFVPKKWPKISKNEIYKFKTMSYQQIAFHVSKKFINGEIDDKNLNIRLEVDGGIKLHNAKKVIDAGADVLVAGSFVFKSDNPSQTIANLKAV